ncbi:hypothetical protein LEMLEM_LOCUS12207 [Lemmus lemmus]
MNHLHQSPDEGSLMTTGLVTSLKTGWPVQAIYPLFPRVPTGAC